MNVPAIAKKSFDQLKSVPEFAQIVQLVIDQLSKLSSPMKRAKFVHNQIEVHNKEVFSHPLVEKFSPCRKGCSACCHTQVSITQDEAFLLVDKIENGLEIDYARLEKQMSVGNNSSDYYQLSFQDRKCIFLDGEGNCKVYQDRPSVCRTNAVLGNADQCDTTVEVKPTRLVLTQKSDMVTYASFLASPQNGTLPYLVGKLLKSQKSEVG